MSLGCAIIAYNEEHSIERALQSVAFCDEIVVVDSGSKDNTVEIAKRYTKKVYFQEWLGYGKQKNFAISKLNTDWVLSLDADEFITPNLSSEIRKAVTYSKRKAFLINIQLVFMGKRLRFGGTYPDYHLRLFKKGAFWFEETNIHEKVKTKIKTGKLRRPILHYSYDNLEDYISKFNLYTTLIAENNKKKGKRVPKVFPFLRMFFELFRRFFLKAAFLDGYPGIVYALLSSFYTFIKYAKLIELNRR